MLPEIPSLPWSEMNQNYAQKTMLNIELDHETTKVPPLPKNKLERCEMWNGCKSWYFLIQLKFPIWGKTRNHAKSFLEFPTAFPECLNANVNQMRNVQEAGFTDLENQKKQAEFASCHLANIK